MVKRFGPAIIVFVAAIESPAVSYAQLSIDGTSEASFGAPSPSIGFNTFNLTYTDVEGRTRRDAGIEIGEATADSRNITSWRFDTTPRRHSNLYEMNSTAFTGVGANTAFALADLNYFNSEIFATGGSIYNLPVQVKLNFSNLVGVPSPTFNFDFRLTFTPNTPGLVDDTLEFGNASSPETFTYGSKTYAVKLKGFSSNNGATFNNTFQLPEYQRVSSRLYAEFEEVLGSRLFVSAPDKLTFQTRVGTTGTRSLEVTNSGAPGTTLTGYVSGTSQPEFGPTALRNFSLAAGESVSRDYTYTPTARTNGTFDFNTLVVSSNAGNEDVVLEGQAFSPIYFSNPNYKGYNGSATGLIAMGRVMNGVGSRLLPISNVTPDGDLAELTDMTIRSMTLGGTNASAFTTAGIENGYVIQAAHQRTATIGLNSTSRGLKAATLTVDTDVNVAFGADGDNYGYDLTATVIDKRPVTASTVNFGRVMGGNLLTGFTTRVAGGVTTDDFFTRPILERPGGSAGGVTVGSTGNEQLFQFIDGRTISTRNVTALFTSATVGPVSGSVPLSVRPEGLTGEGTYSLAVPYTATVIQKRPIEATPVDFGRFIAGTPLSGFQTQVSGTPVASSYYTVPVLEQAGNADGGVTVSADTDDRAFDVLDGTPISTRDVSAVLPGVGAMAGEVPLSVRAEGGIAGEGDYSLAVQWTGTGIRQREVLATPVDFGRFMVGQTLSGYETQISAPASADNFYTNPVLDRAGNAVDPVTVDADTDDRTFEHADGRTIGTRAVSGTFATPGRQSGTVPLTVRGEGLQGEGSYPLEVAWSGTAVEKRQVQATPVDFGRVMAGRLLTVQTDISAPVTQGDFYTNPVLDRAGNTVAPVTVGTDTVDRTFDASDGRIIGSRPVSATFTTPGALAGSVPLTVRPEGLAGEGEYELAVPWTATVVADRPIVATPVSFGKAFTGTPLTGSSVLSTTGASDLYTNVTVHAGSYANAPATAELPQTTVFNAANVTAGANLGASFAAVGNRTGTVTLNAANGGVSGEGLAGETIASVDINYDAQIYSHGVPSFTSGQQSRELTLNVGTFSFNTGVKSVPFDLHNLLSSAFTADIDYDGILSATGETGRLFTDLPGTFAGLAGGARRSYLASLDTSAPGAFSAQYVLDFHDERDIAGAGGLPSLTLNLTGTVAGGGNPPRSNIFIVNPGFEEVRAEVTSTADIQLLKGEYTAGMSNTVTNLDSSRYVTGWISDNNFDGFSGVIRPADGVYGAGEPEGENVAFIGGMPGETFTQRAVGTFEADETYELSFKVGRRAGETFVPPTVDILMGDTLLNPIGAVLQPTPAEGEFETWQYRYLLAATDPLFDLPVTIRVTANPNGVANLDDFRLFIPGDFVGASVSTWNWGGGGNWSEIGKWTNGVPNFAGSEARFYGSIANNSTVTLDGNYTVGTLRFDHTRAYNLTATGTNGLTLETAGGDALVDVKLGAHRITAAVTTADNARFDLAAGTTLTVDGAINNPAGNTLTKTGPGTLWLGGPQRHGPGAGLVVAGGTVNVQTNLGLDGPNVALHAQAGGTVAIASAQRLASLTIDDGALVRVAKNGSRTIETNTLTVSATNATLDLFDNAMVVRNGSLAAVTARIRSALENNGNFDWRGPGITSSVAAERAQTDGATQLAVVGNDQMGYSSFLGVTGLTGSANEILVRLTWVGDTDLDRDVDSADFTAFLVGAAQGVGGWDVGDFDYNGRISGADFTAFLTGLSAYNGGVGRVSMAQAELLWGAASQGELTFEQLTDAIAVPEPGCALIIAASMPLVLSRRRRRSA